MPIICHRTVPLLPNAQALWAGGELLSQPKNTGEGTRATARHVRTLIERLISAGLVSKRRRGWNRSNTYTVSRELRIDIDGKSGSYHLGSKFPLHRENVVPDKSTYLKGKGKKSSAGFEKLKESLVKRGLFRQR